MLRPSVFPAYPHVNISANTSSFETLSNEDGPRPTRGPRQSARPAMGRRNRRGPTPTPGFQQEKNPTLPAETPPPPLLGTLPASRPRKRLSTTGRVRRPRPDGGTAARSLTHGGSAPTTLTRNGRRTRGVCTSVLPIPLPSHLTAVIRGALNGGRKAESHPHFPPKTAPTFWFVLPIRGK